MLLLDAVNRVMAAPSKAAASSTDDGNSSDIVMAELLSPPFEVAEIISVAIV